MKLYFPLSLLKLKRSDFNNKVTIYDIWFNDKKINGWKCKSQKNHFKQNNILRNIIFPLNETIYLFKNKKGINTLGFKQNFDIIICDYYGKILKIHPTLDNNFTSKYNNDAFFIYVCPVGTIAYFNMNESDRLTTTRKKSRSRIIF